VAKSQLSVCLLAVVLADCVFGGTNTLWISRVESMELTKTPLPKAFHDIERLSTAIDPKGNGIRIIGSLSLGHLSVPPISLAVTNTTLIDLLTLCTEAAGLSSPVVVEDVAFVGHAKFRYFEYTLHGKCIVSLRQECVTPFEWLG